MEIDLCTTDLQSPLDGYVIKRDETEPALKAAVFVHLCLLTFAWVNDLPFFLIWAPTELFRPCNELY